MGADAKGPDGKAYQLTCTITEVKEEQGKKTYTVLYKDKNSDFYEKRTFEEGTGVIAFEKLWISGADKIEMGYTPVQGNLRQ